MATDTPRNPLSQDSDPLRSAAAALAPFYGKGRGVLVASGLAALDLAMELAEVGAGDEVVVPEHCCYRVAAAVVRREAVPVFAPVDRHLTLDPAAVCSAIGPRTRAVLAVHHLGLPCPVAALRRTVPRAVRLVEDAAQAFGLRSEGVPVGRHSDLVVTSLGPGKPLSLDGGGGVFGDYSDLADALDGYGPGWRKGTVLPRPYPLHAAAVAELNGALAAARELVERRRSTVNQVLHRLAAAGLEPWTGRLGDLPSWHRLPVWPRTSRIREAALTAGGAAAVVQEPHATALPNLPMFRSIGRRAGPARALSSPPLLLRVDDAEALEGWLRELPVGTGDGALPAAATRAAS